MGQYLSNIHGQNASFGVIIKLTMILGYWNDIEDTTTKSIEQVWANMPNRNSLTEWTVTNGWSWVLSLSLMGLWGQGHGGHPPWDQVPCPTLSSGMSPCWCTWLQRYPGTSRQKTCWTHHSKRALITGQFWRDACYHPRQVILTQGLCNFHKCWWGWWSLTDGDFWLWLHLQGWSCQFTNCLVVVEVFSHPSP